MFISEPKNDKHIYAIINIIKNNIAYQPITREKFDIGSRIRSKNADGFIWDLFLCKFSIQIKLR